MELGELSETRPGTSRAKKPQRAQRDANQTCNALAHGGYEAIFEPYFVDLGCPEKHNFPTALLQAESITM